MGLRSFLDDPSVGPIFSAYAAIALLLVLIGFLSFEDISAFRSGQGFNFREAGVIVLSGALIVRIFFFLRSRHGSR